MRPHDELDVRTSQSTTGPVITVVGELDPFTAPTFDRAIDALVTSAGERVVVDLAGVEFIDSAGLRCLLIAQRRFEELEVEFVLRSPSPIVRRLLEITLIDSVIRIEE